MSDSVSSQCWICQHKKAMEASREGHSPFFVSLCEIGLEFGLVKTWPQFELKAVLKESVQSTQIRIDYSPGFALESHSR